MTNRLRHEEFMPHVPDAPGPTSRVNHDSQSCSGQSRSMAVWMNNDGTYGAKCHRCGATGFSKAGKPSGFKSVPKSKKVRYEIPEDTEYDWAKWPVKSIAYVNKFGFDMSTTARYGIGFSHEMDRLIFPATNLAMKSPGWQAKSFGTGTRYITSTRFPQYMYTHLYNPEGTKAVIITEDLFSAIRARDVLSSFAVLGTGISDQMISELRQYYDTFYIWLDNDNPIVKEAQLKMANKLSLFGTAVVIKSDKEPKECTPEEIKDVLIAAVLVPDATSV